MSEDRNEKSWWWWRRRNEVRTPVKSLRMRIQWLMMTVTRERHFHERQERLETQSNPRIDWIRVYKTLWMNFSSSLFLARHEITLLCHECDTSPDGMLFVQMSFCLFHFLALLYWSCKRLKVNLITSFFSLYLTSRSKREWHHSNNSNDRHQ